MALIIGPAESSVIDLEEHCGMGDAGAARR